MTYDNPILPITVLNSLRSFFSENLIANVVKELHLGWVEISFIKDSSPNYYIVAGIVRDEKREKMAAVAGGKYISYGRNEGHSVRITIRNNGTISSSCDCAEWNKSEHCQHVVVLFIKYHLQDQKGPSLPPKFNLNKIESWLHLTTPKKFNGKIRFVLDKNLSLKFHYLDNNQVEHWDVIISKSTYLIKYSSSEIFWIPEPLQAVIKKLQQNYLYYSLDDLLQVVLNGGVSDLCSIVFNNQIIDHLPVYNNISGHLSIQDGGEVKKGYFKLSLYFLDEDKPERRLTPPSLTKLFTFQGGGLLAHFLKKTDAYSFLTDLGLWWKKLEDRATNVNQEIAKGYNYAEYSEENTIPMDDDSTQDDELNILYQKIIRGTQSKLIEENSYIIKEIINDYIDWIKSNHPFITYYFSPEETCLYECSLSSLWKLFHSLERMFGDIFFRQAEYDLKNKAINFWVPSTVILNKISDLNNCAQQLKINTSYHGNAIETWNPSISFERKNISQDWFELKLTFSEEDLKIITAFNNRTPGTVRSKQDINPLQNPIFSSRLDVNANSNSNSNYFFINNNKLTIIDPKRQESVKFLLENFPRGTIKSKTGNSQIASGSNVHIESSTTINTLTNESDNQGNTSGQITHQISLTFYRHKIFELFELYKLGFKNILTPSEVALCNKLLSFEKIPSYSLPEIANVNSRGYQIVGYNWLRFLYEHRLGACLADDMGLGKTLQTVMLIKSILDQINRVLIICPVSIILNWKNEISKFSGLEAEVYYGGKRSFPEESKIILTSYGVMRKEVESILNKYQFDILVLDEVQHLKNAKSLGSRAVRKINANFRLSLTGTPVENDISEFCNIIDICVPGIWKNTNRISSDPTEVKQIARPFLLRRTKKQVLKELPEKIDNLVMLNFSAEEKKNYVSNLLQIRQRLEEMSAASKQKYGEIFKSILRLRELCLWQHPDHMVGEGTHISHNSISPFLSTKIDFMLESLEQIKSEGHQTIIFSQFTTYLDLIEKKISALGWGFSRIDGKQSFKKRQKEIDAFQGGESKIFLISLRAGGVGLNLTAASYIFLMDPWWNPAVENQAIDRAHRIGQKNKLTIYRLIIKDSIEEKVLNLQDHKRKLFDELLDTGNAQFFSGKLSKEDFEWLLDA